MLNSAADRIAEFIKRPVGVLVLALWFALLAGYVEAAVHLFRQHVLHRMVWTTPDIVWVAPVAYAIMFAPLAIGLYWATRKAGRSHASPFVVGVFAFPMALVASLMIIGTRVHWIAHLVLAVGIAVRCGRLYASHRLLFGQVVARTTPVLVALTLTLALFYPTVRLALERRAVAQLSAARAGAPNILLIIWDTVRRDHLSLYGYERPTTPHLERWAANALVFDGARSPASWTLPTHASIFTGRLTQELSSDFHAGLDRKYPTIAEELSRSGYYTSAFVANLVATQHDAGLNRGFLHYEDYQLIGSSFFLSTLGGQRIARPAPFNRGPIRYYPMKIASTITSDFLRWLPKTEGHPFFAFLNYIDAHHGNPAPEDLQRKFGAKGRVNKYDAAIAALDRELERLFTELNSRGLRENTVVVLASDHGEHFGEKGLHRHGNSLYQPVLAVPLVVWLPEEPGRRVPEPVSLRDLALTILEIADVPPRPTFHGTSLSRFWAGAGSTRADTLIAGVQRRLGTPNHEPNSKGDMSAAITKDYSYILNGDGREELFHLGHDPEETTNIANDRSSTPHLSKFRSFLRANVPAEWLRSMPASHANISDRAPAAEDN